MSNKLKQKWEVKLRFSNEQKWADLEVYVRPYCSGKKIKEWARIMLKTIPKIKEIRVNVEGSQQGYYFPQAIKAEVY